MGWIRRHLSTPKPVVGAGERSIETPSWIGPGFVFAIALLVRGVYLWETREVPFVQALVGDAAGYVAWAERIAAGDWIGAEPFYQAPLYPYVLACILKVFGPDVWAIRLVQAVWGSAACALLCLAARSWFDRRVGVISGLMLALYAPAVFYDGIVQKASLGGVLVCAMLLTMSRVTAGAGRTAYAVLGATGGLLALTRENALAWVAVLGVWVLISRHGARGDGEGASASRVRLARLGALLGGVALVLLPVSARNFAVGGAWSPTTYQLGPNFYIGNHRGADGRYQPLVRGHETPAFERDDATRLAERDAGRKLTPGEVSDYWLSRAWVDLRAEPMAWLRLIGRKLLMVWNRYEVADAESMVVYADASWVLSVLRPAWHFGALAPLAAIGIWLTGRTRRRFWVIYVLMATMTIAVAMFFVLGRYRYPLVPLLIPFASVSVVRMVEAIIAGRSRTLVTPLVLAALVAAVANWRLHNEARLDALARMNAGVALARRDDFAGAAKYFRAAVDAHPTSAEANVNLAQALAVQERYADAIVHYRRALAVEPRLPGVHYNLGVALEHVGRVAEAVGHYEAAPLDDPNYADAQSALERLRKNPRR